jgi:hypothetical protein
MSNDEAGEATNYGKASKVKGKEVFLCHFLGLAYPKTPATTAPKIAR